MSELVELAEKAMKARDILMGLAHVNVAGITPERRVALDVQYRRAELAWQEAELLYQQALRAELNLPS